MLKFNRIVAISALILASGAAMAQTSPEEQKKLELLKQEALMKEKANQQAPVAVPTSGPAGTITFTKKDVDFGNINDDKPAIHEFEFSNTGKGTLVIQSVQGSCGCTVPALQKREYLPGETGKIRVEYNPHNRRGKQHTTVTVTSNDPANGQQKLDINSNVIPQIQIDPPIVNFGQLDRGKEAVQKFTVTSRSPDLKVLQVTSNNQFVTATMGTATPAEMDGQQVMQYPVELKVMGTAPSGQVQTMVSITTTDDKRVLTLTGMGEIVGSIAPTPNRIQLGGVTPNQPINTQVRLASRNNKAFKIVSVEDLGSGGQKFFTSAPSIVTDTSVDPPAYLLNFTASGGATGSIRGDILVTTDSVEEPTVKIPYFGFVRANAPAAGQNPLGKQNPAGAPSPAWQQNPSSLIPQ